MARKSTSRRSSVQPAAGTQVLDGHVQANGMDRTALGQSLESVIAAFVAERSRTEETLHVLTGRLLHAQEDERRSVARELHDGLNQALAMLRVEVGIVLSRVPPSSRFVRRQLTKIRDRVQELSEEVRRISHRLHPAVLEHLGLISALRSYCSEFSEYQHIHALFVHEGPDDPIPFEVAVCLYRIVQEALRNVGKHAKASTVLVSLHCDKELRLSIADDGQGFDALDVKKNSGLGLASMEERARIVGGTFSIDSQPGNGTRIEIIVPPGRKRDENTYQR